MNLVAQGASALALVVLASAPARAAVFGIAEPWVRPAAAGASTEAFMQLTSSEAAVLVDVRAPDAKRVRLVSRQGPQAPPFALELPARATVTLAPGGVRVALLEVSRALKLRERVPLTLVLRHADGTTQEIPVEAEVRRRSPSDDHGVAHKP